MIFEQVGVGVSTGNFIILFVNLLGNVPAFFLIQKFGRRPLLLWSMVAVSVLYIVIGLSAIYGWPYLLLTCTALVLGVLQLAVLPFGYLYVNEMSNTKALSVAVGSNWFLQLLTGLGMGPLVTHPTVGPYAFLMFSGTNSITLVFLFLFMKETKDLPEAQIRQLYMNDNAQYSAWGWNQTVKKVTPTDDDVELEEGKLTEAKDSALTGK